MSTNGKILLAIFGLFFIGVVIWVVQTTPDSPPPLNKVEPPKTMEYEGNTISEEVNGVKIWDLTAEKVIVDLATQNAELINPIGHFYQENGKTIELKANHGNYENDSKNVLLEGNVIGQLNQTDGRSIELHADICNYTNEDQNIHVEGSIAVTTSDGAKLTSGKLDWNGKNDTLIATEKVRITKDDMRATGDSAESRDGFSHFWLRGNAHIIKGVKND